MVNLKNQKGYVLLIVMVLIMVFTVLGLSLLTLNITSAKQFNNKEKIVQARHTAEMGALHYKAHIAKEWGKTENDINAEINKFNGLKKKDREDYLNLYRDKIIFKNKEFCENIKIYFLETAEYKATTTSTMVSCNAPFLKDEEWEFAVTIENKPTSQNDKVVKLSATVKMNTPFYEVKDNLIGTADNSNVKKPKKNKDKKDPSQNPNVYIEDVFVTHFSTSTKGWIVFNKNVYAENSFTLQPHSCVIVKGDFNVDNNLNAKNKSTLFIYGDADIPTDYDYHNNHGGIFVAGNMYIDGVLQDPKPQMGNPNVNLGNCKVPSDFVIKNPSEITDEPVLTVIYN